MVEFCNKSLFKANYWKKLWCAFIQGGLVRIIVEEIIDRTIGFLLKDGHCGTASLNISTRMV